MFNVDSNTISLETSHLYCRSTGFVFAASQESSSWDVSSAARAFFFSFSFTSLAPGPLVIVKSRFFLLPFRQDGLHHQARRSHLLRLPCSPPSPSAAGG